MNCIIDTSALMALIQEEPGGDYVADVICSATASAVILAECLSKLANKGHDPVRMEASLMGAGLSIAAVGMEDIAPVVALHRLAIDDVSLADRFCLGLALQRGLPLVTADRPWALLGLPIELRFIR